jgi:hypothetical protein
LLFFSAGARTPLLALLSLRRLRNLALVVLPYGPGLLLVAVLGPSLTEPDRAGLLAVAIAPALLTAPALSTAMGGRMDRAGALLVGTIAASFILTLSRAGAAGGAMQSAMFAFVVGAGVVSVVPMLPAVARTTVQRLGDIAFSVIIAVAILGSPALSAGGALAAAALFGATVVAAAIVARVAGVELRSAIAGAGTRDPAVAIALAVALGGPGAAGVPIYSAALLLVLGAAFVAANRRKTR